MANNNPFDIANTLVECGLHRHYDYHLGGDDPSCQGCRLRRGIVRAIEAATPQVTPQVTRDSGVVDMDNLEANQYGCLRCPECDSRARMPYQNSPRFDGASVVECEGCGFVEAAVFTKK